MQLIGVVGFIGSGKGSVGDILQNNYGYKKLAFADSLKDAVSDIFHWPRHLLEGDTKESREFRETEDAYWTQRMGRPITPRTVLQQFGSECMRDCFGEDIWVTSLMARIMLKYKQPIPIVITDCRFPNEIREIQKLGGNVVRVVRGPEPEWYENALSANAGYKFAMEGKGIHISEWAWIGQEFDYVIQNNSTLKDLEIEVTKMLLSFDNRGILHTSP